MSTTTAGHIASVSVDVGGQEIIFETGKLAKQADGAVVVRSGETMVLATASGRPEAREGADFFPLTVDVEERMYAAGKIPGGFFKREGRATERAILTARMIDRPIRPLWPKGFRNEVQVICTVLSADLVTPHDILCINGASAALMISPLPFLGPVGAVRIGRIDGEFVVNPTLRAARGVDARPDRRRHEGGADDGRGRRRRDPRGHAPRGARARARGDRKICAAPGGASRRGRQAEVARRRPHRRARARRTATTVGSAIAERRAPRGRRRGRGARRGALPGRLDGLDRGGHRRAGADPREPRSDPREGAPGGRRRARCASSSRPTCARSPTPSRTRRSSSRRSASCCSTGSSTTVELPFPVGPATAEGEARRSRTRMTKQYVKRAAEAIYKDLVRKKIAVDKRRPDGRAAEEIRPDRVRGAGQPAHARLGALHARPDADHDAAHARHREGGPADRRPLARADRRYMHHYNFPPYSVGETGFMRGPKRRDIGHGALAQRALEPMIPSARGLPVHDPARLGDARVERLVVDGLGLRLDARADGRRRADQGAGLRHRDGPRQGGRRLRHPHRHPGRRGSPRRHGLQGRRHAGRDHRAADGHQDHRRHAGDHAEGARAGEAGARVHPRQDGRGDSGDARRSWPTHAPRISTVKIDPEQIGMVIGKGGETIRALEADYDVQIDIEEDGTILIYATEGTKARGRDRGDRGAHEGARGRGHLHGQGREDDPVRRVRRAEEGHRRPAPRLERRPGPGRPHRGRDRAAATSSTSSSRRWTRSAAGSASSSSRSTRTAASSSPRS